MAERIMVASGKGGVGKSTICLGLASGLAARQKRVLLLEADTGFRGLDIPLALQEGALYDLSDLLEHRCTTGEALLRHNRTGVELLCAPNDPEYLPEEQKLAELLDELDQRYDFILADCGAGFGPVHGRVARHSSAALLVTTPDAPAVRAAARTSLLLRRNGVANQRLIINRIPRELPPSAGVRDLDEVIDLVGAQLIGAVPEGRITAMPTAGDGLAGEELFRIAARICGEQLPLAILRQ